MIAKRLLDENENWLPEARKLDGQVNKFVKNVLIEYSEYDIQDVFYIIVQSISCAIAGTMLLRKARKGKQKRDGKNV